MAKSQAIRCCCQLSLWAGHFFAITTLSRAFLMVGSTEETASPPRPGDRPTRPLAFRSLPPDNLPSTPVAAINDRFAGEAQMSTQGEKRQLFLLGQRLLQLRDQVEPQE